MKGGGEKRPKVRDKKFVKDSGLEYYGSKLLK